MRNCVRLLPQVFMIGTLLAVAGCHVEVDKGKNGEDKNVRVDTPLGGLHVRSDQTTALDLGLPAYPGAQISPDHEGDKSADVHFGFGQFQLRVRVVSYQTSDDRDKVIAFYKNAMGRFGEVLTCQGNHAVGSPSTTAEGLTCSEDAKIHGSNFNTDNDSLTLRAGSRHHQHIVAMKNGGPGTRFALVELQLPAGLEEHSAKTSD
ncbi:MAG: hypothetical protein ACLGXA_19955 [Acidobacteriota bacterium]